MTARAHLVATIWILVSPVLWAETSEPLPPLNIGDGASYVGLVYLALFLLFFGALYFFLKRGSFPRSRSEGALRIAETRMLGGRQFLVVGEYRDRKFLLGVCPGKIDYLCDLGTDPREEETFEKVIAGKGDPVEGA